MRMKEFKNKAPGFDNPTMTPKSEVDAENWQSANREWWEENPMRYDWLDSIGFSEFSKEFYKEIDRRFYENADDFATGNLGNHFDKLIDFHSLKSKDVLEIGVGMGSHAQLIAPEAKTYTGIDLTSYGTKTTTERLKVFELPGRVFQMDAERMEFSNESFDYVWSWGVIHHSSNTKKIISEIHRILRPRGKAAIMVYYRSWWSYCIVGLLRGVLSGNIFKTGSLSKVVQSYTDGAIARYYTFPEWRNEVSPYFSIDRMFVLGPKTDVLIIPSGRIKKFLKKLMPKWLSNFLTRHLRMGVFLFSEITKK